MALCSIAVAAGIVGVMVVVKRLFFRRRLGHLAFGGGPCGGGGFGAGPGHRRGRFGRREDGIGRSFWLRALYARLDTTPGQEREIRTALEELRERARDAKTGLPETRTNLAQAIAGATFDETAFEVISARVDATAEKMKDAFASALKRIHGALDDKQRQRLAAIVSAGGFGRWGRGGYRDGSGGGGPYRGGADV